MNRPATNKNVCAMVAGHQGMKFSLYYICTRGQDAVSISQPLRKHKRWAHGTRRTDRHKTNRKYYQNGLEY